LYMNAHQRFCFIFLSVTRLNSIASTTCETPKIELEKTCFQHKSIQTGNMKLKPECIIYFLKSCQFCRKRTRLQISVGIFYKPG
jgi:hypothetical protein